MNRNTEIRSQISDTSEVSDIFVNRNVEIKARIGDWNLTHQRAETLSDSPRAILRQEDVFFTVPAGRLKLRILAPDHGGAFPRRGEASPPNLCPARLGGDASPLQRGLPLPGSAPDHGELIYYQRADTAGPKTSNYLIARTPEPDTLRATLSAALGVRGVVRKERWLYLVGQTRIHLDQVEGLGAFLELEVVLGPDDTPEHGQVIAERLMQQLGVQPADLIDVAYIDLLDVGVDSRNLRDSGNLRRLSIRPFRPEDQAATQALILAGMEEHWGHIDPTLNPDLDDIAANYAAGLFLTAWQDGALVGTGALVHEAEGVARIVRMSVDQRLRRGGIGRQILARLIEHARSNGYGCIVLETTDTWSDAIAFYLRCGFHTTGSRDGELNFALNL